ncbi:MAG: DUF4198 domain-containing protein [Flavobacterium sp.]|nr:DUF4198 domain-containing protein [Flavobacterium sp.]
MKKSLLILVSFFLLKCAVPYDGEARYIFTTTVLDKNNNPIPNLEISVNFYNGDYHDNSTNYINVNEFDKIVQSTTDANGIIKLVFPFAAIRENVSIRFGDNTYPEYEIINIKKNNFVNYELNEPPFVLYRFNDATLLSVKVINSSLIKYVSKIELIGEKREAIKNYNIQQEPIENSSIRFKDFNPVKNQNVLLRYEITTITNGQSSFEVVEESITILENELIYEIIL